LTRKRSGNARRSKVIGPRCGKPPMLSATRCGRNWLARRKFPLSGPPAEPLGTAVDAHATRPAGPLVTYPSPARAAASTTPTGTRAPGTPLSGAPTPPPAIGAGRRGASPLPRHQRRGRGRHPPPARRHHSAVRRGGVNPPIATWRRAVPAVPLGMTVAVIQIREAPASPPGAGCLPPGRKLARRYSECDGSL
jgi:hypothetical protein